MQGEQTIVSQRRKKDIFNSLSCHKTRNDKCMLLRKILKMEKVGKIRRDNCNKQGTEIEFQN